MTIYLYCCCNKISIILCTRDGFDLSGNQYPQIPREVFLVAQVLSTCLNMHCLEKGWVHPGLNFSHIASLNYCKSDRSEFFSLPCFSTMFQITQKSITRVVNDCSLWHRRLTRSEPPPEVQAHVRSFFFKFWLTKLSKFWWLNPPKFMRQFLAGMNTFFKKEGVCCTDSDTHQNHTWNSCCPTPIHTVDHVSVPCLSRNVVNTFHVVIWIDPTRGALKSNSSVRHWNVSPASQGGISSDGKKYEFSPQNKPLSWRAAKTSMCKHYENFRSIIVLPVLCSQSFFLWLSSHPMVTHQRD